MTIARDSRYRAEKVPPSLLALTVRLGEFFGVGPEHFGIKGGPKHLGGYHRSRRFLAGSPAARDRNYSVTDAPGNLGGDPDWCCGLDISLPPHQLIPMCRRLDAAVRAGRLEKVAEWFGNDDGDNRVDGYNNVANTVASSDPSHLWHAHLGIIRARAGEGHDDLYAVLTGEGEDELNADEKKLLKETADSVAHLLSLLHDGKRFPLKTQTSGGGKPIAWIVEHVSAVEASVAVIAKALERIGAATPVVAELEHIEWPDEAWIDRIAARVVERVKELRLTGGNP